MRTIKPKFFWALRDARGELYAYSLPDTGVRCTDRVDYAMHYKTRKGALIAASNVRRAYGKLTEPVHYQTVVTYQQVKP